MNNIPANILRISHLSRIALPADLSCRNCPLPIGSAFRRRMGASSYYASYKLPASIVAKFALHTRYSPSHCACCSSSGLPLVKFRGRAFSWFPPVRPYNPADPEVTVLKRLFFFTLLVAAALAPAPCCAQQVSQGKSSQEKEQFLWQKLETTISEVDHNLNGVLGVAILDLSTGQKYLLHADEVLPTASSIKIAILAELVHQVQQGKLKF